MVEKPDSRLIGPDQALLPVTFSRVLPLKPVKLAKSV